MYGTWQLRLNHNSIRFFLYPAMPFRLDLTAWALRRRSGNTVDVWQDETYRRVLAINDQAVLVEVTQERTKLCVTVTSPNLCTAVRQKTTLALERLLGFRHDLSNFYNFASHHPRLNKLATQFRGLKPPRFASVFEGIVNGISCQQLSLTVGIIILNRLAERCGLSSGPGMYAFPRPEDVARLNESDFRSLGYSGNKARALIELSGSIIEGRLDLRELERLDNRECFERLVALRGVGRWTAEYVLLRGLGRTNVFPGDDVGARNNLERWLGLRKKLDYERVQRVLSEWKDYSGFIFLHLLLKSLAKGGHLD
jgi:DNA-3-methyladenine glycosylase II